MRAIGVPSGGVRPVRRFWLWVVIAVAAAVFALSQQRDDVPQRPVPAEVEEAGGSAEAQAGLRQGQVVEIGFRNLERLEEHFQKHGREFGQISRAEYLRRAQALRDAPVGGSVLELKRADGVITRFDKESGAFIAFDPDLIIRTFFRPNQGERYFRRQAARDQS